MAFRFLSRSAPIPNTQPAISKKRRPIVYVLWLLLIAVIGVVAWIGITGAIALKSIIANNNNGASTLHTSLTPTDVKTEGDSRINILLAGIGGPGHSGPDLTDTLELYSIDPINKSVTVLSIPRDLYVPLPDGSHGRINAINTEGAQYCVKNNCAAGTDAGGAAMEGAIGKILGININYFVRLNFTGFQQLVDNLGGVDVTVPTALYDPLYPCPDPSTAYCPIRFKVGAQHFDGTAALKYARSRETTSDFSRAARQQLVIAAMRSKALTIGTLANPNKITQLLSILGKNLKTDVQTGDLTTLVNLVEQIDGSKTNTVVLDTSLGSPITSAVIGGADVLVPRKGLSDFSEVQLFVDSALKDPYVIKEAATVTIIDASGKPAIGTTVEAQLKRLGYNVTGLAVATKVQTGTTVTNSKNKPFTSSLLQSHFGAAFTTASSAQTTDIVLTIGSKYVVK